MVRYSYDHTLSKKASLLLKRSRKVKAWYNEVSGLLQIRTATDYVDDLARVVEDVKKTPEQLLKMRPKTIYNLLKGWVISKTRSDMLSHKRSHAMWYAVSSFLKFHEQHIGGDFPLRRLVVKNLDKIPTKQDLKLIMNAASSLSTKISILLMAYSGLRPEDVCDLTYASIKHDFERGVYPCAVHVMQGKTGEPYITFLPKSTAQLIKQYLKLRADSGEKITDKSPLLSNQQFKDRGIRRRTLSTKIRDVLLKSGVELVTYYGDKRSRMRPYGIRKYFRSNISEKVQKEFGEALIGHTAGLAQVYNGIRDLDPTTIERMRKMYAEAEPFLLVDGVDMESLEQLGQKMKKNEEEIAQLRERLEEYKIDEFQRIKNNVLAQLKDIRQHSEGDKQFIRLADDWFEGYEYGVKGTAADLGRDLNDREKEELPMVKQILEDAKKNLV